jgi:hypothetical protein
MEPVLRTIVSEGKRTCIFTESKMIPKYSSRERGMFNLLNPTNVVRSFDTLEWNQFILRK